MAIENGTATSKPCPKCGPATPLVVRTNGKTGEYFLGCDNWPECKHTEELPESMRLTLLGAKKLL